MWQALIAIVLLIAVWQLTKLMAHIAAHAFDSQGVVTVIVFICYPLFFYAAWNLGRLIYQYEDTNIIGILMLVIGFLYILVKNPITAIAAVGIGAVIATKPWKD